jgi:hypothetical protein
MLRIGTLNVQTQRRLTQKWFPRLFRIDLRVFRVSVRSTDPSYLTFWHWSGVTPYTSSYEFAGSCVFDKQSPGHHSLRPSRTSLRSGGIFKSQFPIYKHSVFCYLNFGYCLFFGYWCLIIPYQTQCGTAGRALSRTYGRCFAEFLGKDSLVRLGLLDPSTCVGFGTVST